MSANKVAIFKLFSVVILCWIFYGVNSKTQHQQQQQQRGCQIKIPNDIPKGEPLYLSGSSARYRLFKPINETSYLAVNSKLTLFCPGKRNNLFGQKTNFTELTCGNGNHFVDVNNNHVQLSQFNCTRGIEGDVHVTKETCSNNRGKIYEIGFRLDRNNFLTVFKVCFDILTETTYFSTNRINGPVVKYFVKDSRRRNFKTIGMSANTNINKVYDKKHQITRFEALFGSYQTFINKSMHLSRGHLTPDADFVFPNFQLATYFYINVAPEFQSINGGNWVRVENMARELASDYNTEFEIFTGVHDTLSLSNRWGQAVDIHLDAGRKTSVPKWFWKAIKNIRQDAAIVMITLNNPFANRQEIVEFCPNICKKASLTSKHFENSRKGYTFCCSLDEFRNVVHDLPRNFTATHLLECARANHIFNEL